MLLGQRTVFVRKLLNWYKINRRDLPWRPPLGQSARPDPYAVLVSELMLQQTQVATVIPYFHRFMARFPTPAHLAEADEQEILRLWQGLGYYSRARNLHAAARSILANHTGQVPNSIDALLALPGVGRYTAGAIASIAFGVKAPILDGNVARVLCRLDKIQSDPRLPATQRLLWQRTAEILPKHHVGEFNSALMELGATICTPRKPHCLNCPVRSACQSFAAGLQDQIPLPKKSLPTPLFHRWTFCLQHNSRWLIEQRPAKGRWAGLWQFITLEPRGKSPSPAFLHAALGLQTTSIRKLGQIRHALTHRRYLFDVFTVAASSVFASSPGTPGEERGEGSSTQMPCRWVTLNELDLYPLPRPHVKIAQMLAQPKK